MLNTTVDELQPLSCEAGYEQSRGCPVALSPQAPETVTTSVAHNLGVPGADLPDSTLQSCG